MDPETGLDPITHYEVYWDNGNFQVLGTEWVLFVTQEASTATFEFIESSGVIRSDYYKFKYLAINE